ncbi:O-antigen ligase family protein (plasmid) [Salipiger sp. H15]|uniref:O-antigen ligase family protein n=1 Tax=Alloyangia sp. H15 TaxID=3029062 RepID=A0AAU8AQH9_9RHOB
MTDLALTDEGRVAMPSAPQLFASGYVVSVALTYAVGQLAAVGLLACGMGMLLSRPVASTNFLLRYWFILVLPLYCVASTLWSLHPSASLRHGIQLLVTVIFAILAARNLSVRQIRFLIVGSFLATTLLSLASGNINPYTGALIGVYGSKNALAGATAVLLVAAVLLLIDPEESRWRKALALLALLSSALAVILAKSAGTWVLVPMVLSVVWMGYVFSTVSPLTRVVQIVIFVLVVAIVVTFVLLNLSDVIYYVLTLLQKDITLTGRTVLWSEALKLISERPLLGVGYQAFWVQGYGPAETIWRDFGIEARTGFHFHNLYISNAVEIGVVGVAMQILLLYGGFLASFVLAVRTRSSGVMLLAALCAMSILHSMIEVPILVQFEFRSSMTVSALVYAIEGLRGRLA